MVQPSDDRYNIAVTKVFGEHLYSIIVDTENTARRCIQILKEKMLTVETFLPLDNLEVEPLQELLRNITEPKNVKLAFDVLKFDVPEIERAVLFVTNNVLVCETLEDAMKVSCGLDKNNYYDALALDGTFFHKSGMISGGKYDLAIKAKCWNEKEFAQLKMKKEELNAELKKLVKESDKKCELASVESRIKSLANTANDKNIELEKAKKSISEYDRKIEKLKLDLDTFMVEIFISFYKFNNLFFYYYFNSIISMKLKEKC